MADDKNRWGSGSYETHVYAVEARAAFGSIVLKAGEPSPFGGEVNVFSNDVLTPHEWKRIHSQSSPVGVPNRLGLYAEAQAHGFLTYQCAMALACWFQSIHSCAETRVVQVAFKCSYSTREVGVGPVMNLTEEGRQLHWHLTGQNGGKVRSALPESPLSADAVDATSTGTPSTRE